MASTWWYCMRKPCFYIDHRGEIPIRCLWCGGPLMVEHDEDDDSESTWEPDADDAGDGYF